ncbi:heparan-alpha-glucosaminide N-acetyltransferase isoform X1 [Maylandia zebra]|uniref:heparan-alpha-glucosaminide N-acetyltransferase isoform X1 n=1 Tax=Maylandia zebra TaxID=106582 RepID=UPI000C243ECB|nr:heparan-alpha-glucosaminide N-acetyltransferase isoform X1 [Maylandia zebra]
MESRTLLHASLTLLILFTSGIGGHIENGSHLKMDQALLIFHNQLTEEVHASYTSDYCYKCLYQHLVTVKPNNNNASAIISTKFTLTVQVESQTRNATFCRWSQTYEEGGHYSIWIYTLDANNRSCTHIVDRRPNNAYLPILVAALLLAVIALLFVVIPYICRRRCTSKFIKTICCQGPQHSEENEESHASETAHGAVKAKPTRLLSLDTFRGFSLTVMVFVNYGGGGYWFFQHAPWNGLTVADLVMPWFVFVIGTSVVLAFSSMQRRGVSRLQLLRKITWRTVVLLLLGFCFLNYSPKDGPLSWSWLRIPGVLQRLGFTYFVLSLLQTFWGQKEIPLTAYNGWNPVQDILLYWPQWLIIILLETLWLCLTFLMPVPNCPTGYLGAGGIGDNGLYPNCTGGAAGYIDRWMFGDNMYRYPTCKEMYRTTQPFDPEGVLSTINSIVIGFLGMQAGKIIIFYKKMNIHILCRFLVWTLILGISAAILSKCTRDGGFIPVNKNLWSLSYIMCMGCLSFLLLGGMFFVVDIKGWWGGQPFIYPGMNSIFVYVGHSLLGFYFPFSWEMRFQQSHWEWLFQSLWGTALWLLIAYLLYRKKFFLKI